MFHTSLGYSVHTVRANYIDISFFRVCLGLINRFDFITCNDSYTFTSVFTELYQLTEMLRENWMIYHIMLAIYHFSEYYSDEVTTLNSETTSIKCLIYLSSVFLGTSTFEN